MNYDSSFVSNQTSFVYIACIMKMIVFIAFLLPTVLNLSESLKKVYSPRNYIKAKFENMFVPLNKIHAQDLIYFPHREIKSKAKFEIFSPSPN